MKKLVVLVLIALLLSACGGGSSQSYTSQDVIDAFQAAGLEAENPTTMAAEDYGAAPMVGEGTRFFVPSLGEGSGGRVVVADNAEDRDKLADFYISMGKESALLFSWVFVKDNTVVQINGSLDEATARQYEAALAAME